MMIVDIYSFLKTGKFGEIGINSLCKDIIENLGEPDGISIDNDLYKYGNVEFGLKGHRIRSISINFHENEFHENLEFYKLNDFLFQKMSIVESVLHDLNIEVRKKSVYDKDILWITNNNFYLPFEDDQLVNMGIIEILKE